MSETQRAMRVTTDALGRRVEAPAAPRRIVSLCPSQTETLLELGAPVIGRTRYCIHPAQQVSGITEVGGTKQVHWPALEALQPDLIIAEKEENRREDVERMARQWPVYVTDVRDIDSALRMIQSVGELVGRAEQAVELAAAIRDNWARLKSGVPLRVAYLIWRRPWMAAGRDTYIHDVLGRCGLENVFGDAQARYPEFSLDTLQKRKPQLVLLSSEPFPFDEQHVQTISGVLPEAHVVLVDGEMFGWYGARMIEAAAYLRKFIDRLRA